MCDLCDQQGAALFLTSADREAEEEASDGSKRLKTKFRARASLFDPPLLPSNRSQEGKACRGQSGRGDGGLGGAGRLFLVPQVRQKIPAN